MIFYGFRWSWHGLEGPCFDVHVPGATGCRSEISALRSRNLLRIFFAVVSKQCLGGGVNGDGADHMRHWAAALSDLATPHKYNVAISACKRAQQWQRALCLLVGLEEVAFEADVIAYTSALSACQAVAEWQQALLLFELFRSFIVGNLITFTSVLSAYSSGMKWGGAAELLCSLQEKELRQDVIACNAAISACGRSGRWLQALGLFEELSEKRTE